MDVNAVAQASQTQPAAVASDGSGGAGDGMFAFLLKHSFGSQLAGGTLLDTSSMLSMVGSAPEINVPAPPSAPPPAPVQPASTPLASNQSGSSGNGPASATTTAAGANVAATDPNGGDADGGAQTNSGDTSQGQQQSTGGSTQYQTTVSTTLAPVTVSATTNDSGADATTEATAAVLAATIYVVQQAQVAAAQPQLAPADFASGGQRAQAGQGPSNGTQGAAATGGTAGSPTGQPIQLQAAEESGSDQETPWSLNFLNAAATTPQIAQQAAGLAQISGQSGASVSTQTTSGTSVSAPSASALVPDAILAIPGFFTGGQQDASADGGTGGQTGGQQTGSDGLTQNATLDPDAIMLAQDAQAVLALSAAMQSVVQDLAAAAPQTAAAPIAAAAASLSATGGEPPAMPQAVPTPAAPAGQANFAGQLQEAAETQAPQATQQSALPSAVDQIKMQIEKGLAQGSTTIKVQLTPENLGRVEVKLDVQNGTVKATITADRPATLQLLQSDQAGMVQALQDAGLNADSTSLSFYLRGDQQRQFAQANRQGRDQSSSVGDDDPQLAAVGATSGASSVAGAGSLDISV